MPSAPAVWLLCLCPCRLGVWDVTSTLTAVELPMGADMLPPPNKRAVQRAQQEDLNKPMRYQVGRQHT